MLCNESGIALLQSIPNRESFRVLSKFHHQCRSIVEYLSFHTGYEISARRASFYYTYHSYSVLKSLLPDNQRKQEAP